MYAVNRLSSHDAVPSAPVFQGITHVICYISVWSHHTIMYPSGIDGTTTHEVYQQIFPGKLHSQNISHGLDAFNKCPIPCAILCLFDVSVHWSSKTQPASTASFPQTQNFSPFNYPPKWSNGYDPSYKKNLSSLRCSNSHIWWEST